jgi:hypothetical protein
MAGVIILLFLVMAFRLICELPEEIQGLIWFVLIVGGGIHQIFFGL